ncbi:MAG: PIG-L deacetylase family protein [Candidatus Promineifilaceae bacterium]
MLSSYNSIYLAPHLDDVALSCGGQVFQQTQTEQSVLVVTVTAGNPPNAEFSAYAQGQHANWQLVVDTVAQRRQEDIKACTQLGTDWLHWDIPDCIYRRHPVTGETFYNSDEALFGVVHSAEIPLINILAQRMLTLPKADTIYVPLGLGDHVDHQLVRQAAEVAFGSRLSYYEDYPYIQRHGVASRIGKIGNNWESALIEISAEAHQVKVEAISAYNSQLSTLFGSIQAMKEQVNTFNANNGGECIWKQA